MQILMFAGKAESGKGTVADIFKELLEERDNRVVVIAFADIIKFYCEKYFGWNGIKDESGRSLLQHIGDIGRDSVRKGYWAERVSDFLHIFKNEFDVALIPDVRYPNEINHVVSNFATGGIYTFWIERIGHDNSLTKDQKRHSSENSLTAEDCDYYITNNSLDQLRKDCEYYVSQITE